MGGMSRSSPSMAAAFNLRQYSHERKKTPISRPPSVPNIDLEYIDVIGGNGKWRQRLAQIEWQKREVEEKERMEKLKILAEEKARKQAAIAERKKKQLEEERRQVLAERERQKREKEEREEKQRQKEEKERLKREEAEREWLARQPKTCETCQGVGKCVTCQGKGTIFSVFLVSKVDSATSITDFGRKEQGCDDCGGYRQNILGQLRPGTGKCAACGGHGKIWPDVEAKGGRPRFNTGMAGGMQISEPSSPKSPFPSMPSSP